MGQMILCLHPSPIGMGQVSLKYRCDFWGPFCKWGQFPEKVESVELVPPKVTLRVDGYRIFVE